jgi:hypothetical protein
MGWSPALLELQVQGCVSIATCNEQCHMAKVTRSSAPAPKTGEQPYHEKMWSSCDIDSIHLSVGLCLGHGFLTRACL